MLCVFDNLLSKRTVANEHEVHLWQSPRKIEHSVGTFDWCESSKKPDDESFLRKPQMIPKPSAIPAFYR